MGDLSDNRKILKTSFSLMLTNSDAVVIETKLMK